MSPQIVAALVLLVVFAIGTVRPVNLGALGLAAAAVVGPLLLGVGPKDVFAGFPGDLFVLVLGVTYLFAIATVNGTVDWLVERCTHLVGGRRALVPVVLFVAAALVTSLGALAPAAVAMLAPVGLRLARRYDVRAPLAALMIVFGATSGNFSPLNPLGAIVNGSVVRVGLPTGGLFLYAVSFAVNVLLGVAVYVLVGGRALLRAPAQPVAVGAGAGGGGGSADEVDEPARDANPVVRSVTLAVLLAVAVLALGFGLDVGTCALVAAVLLTLAMPAYIAEAVTLISWSVILLICGIVTYVALLQKTGTLDQIGHGIAGIASPLLAIVLICFIGGLTSAFASSAGILAAMVPLLAPVIAASGAAAIPIITALAICVTIVDAAPFSSVGALVTTNAPADERAAVHTTLLRWCAAMVVTGPIVTGLLLVLPAF